MQLNVMRVSNEIVKTKSYSNRMELLTMTLIGRVEKL